MFKRRSLFCLRTSDVPRRLACPRLYVPYVSDRVVSAADSVLFVGKESWQHFTTRQKDALLFALAASGAEDGYDESTTVQLWHCILQ